MRQNDISLNSTELDAIIESFKQICLKLVFETKKIEGYSCKSEVIDKYTAIYNQIYQMVSDYRVLLLHDLKSIMEVNETLKETDFYTAYMIKSSPYAGGK